MKVKTLINPISHCVVGLIRNHPQSHRLGDVIRRQSAEHGMTNDLMDDITQPLM